MNKNGHPDSEKLYLPLLTIWIASCVIWSLLMREQFTLLSGLGHTAFGMIALLLAYYSIKKRSGGTFAITLLIGGIGYCLAGIAEILTVGVVLELVMLALSITASTIWFIAIRRDFAALHVKSSFLTNSIAALLFASFLLVAK